jgi:hypothetical protein
VIRHSQGRCPFRGGRRESYRLLPRLHDCRRLRRLFPWTLHRVQVGLAGSPSPKWLSSKPLKNTGLARPAVKLRHPCGCPRRRRKSLWRTAARRPEKLNKKSRLGQRTHHTQTRVQRCSRPLRTARVGPYCGRSTKASVKRADVPCARIWNISISDAFRRLPWKPAGG